MSRRHHVFRRLFYLLLTTLLSATFGAMRGTADDFGYPPPPGPYRGESHISLTAQLPAGQAAADSVGSGAQASRGAAGMLPLPVDTYSASDTADILFGSVPTLPPSFTDSDDPAQQTVTGSVLSPPVHTQTTVPGAPPGDGWSMDLSHERQSGVAAGRQYPSNVPAYPGYQQPAPPYHPGYQAYPSQSGNPSSGYPPAGDYAAPYPRSEPYAMPSTSDPVPDAARYAPNDAMQGYPAGIEMRDLPDVPQTSASEAAARDIFRPAEQD